MKPQDMKYWIDTASYEQLLSRWRFASIGSPWFTGDVGQYYKEVMGKKREEVGDSEHTKTSKAIGF